MSRITVAGTAGFCFGVKRAVQAVEDLIEQGKKVCTLGPLIHNPQFIQQLIDRGVRVVESVDEVMGGETAVIRSHGVSRDVFDELEKKKLSYLDLTCPFVTKIHKIVSNTDKDYDIIAVLGDRQHPEVRGIVGHSSAPAVVAGSFDEFTALFADPEFSGKHIVVVSQTTFSTEEWKKCVDFIAGVGVDCTVHDTICQATAQRQAEAAEIASKCDVMLVIGGKNSSNTAKLYQICSERTKTYYVESASDFPAEIAKGPVCIGVTAGASTPDCIIKEVLTNMSDVVENNSNLGEELDFAAALEDSLKPVHNGDIVKGVVVGITPTEVQIDIGTKHAGYVAVSEFGDQLPSIGDEINLVVFRINDVEGTVGLSKRRYDAMKGWKDILEAHDSGEVLEGKVESAVNAGVLAVVRGTRVFVPASLCSSRRVEDLSTLVGKDVRLKIIDVDNRRHRAIGSVKAVEREERNAAAEKLWSTIEVGNVYKGVVKSMTSYGAFVDIGGADGMIHVSELSWSKISNPAKVLSIGQEVEVFVKAVDKENKKISLGYRKEEDNPWRIFTEKYSVGDVVNVEIVSIVPFGAFAQIIPGIDGLIHISQLSSDRVEKVGDVVKVGDKLDAKIVEIDPERSRVSLSIKALHSDEDASGPVDELGVLGDSSDK